MEPAGYRIYEISNFARAGFRCRHNLAYWSGHPYLGIGPGVHGYTPDAGVWGTRVWNDPGLTSYGSRNRPREIPEYDILIADGGAYLGFLRMTGRRRMSDDG